MGGGKYRACNPCKKNRDPCYSRRCSPEEVKVIIYNKMKKITIGFGRIEEELKRSPKCIRKPSGYIFTGIVSS